MATNSSTNTPPDAAHEDLLATLAAARELDPEMDKALADQYLSRRQEEQKKQQQQQNTQAVVPQQQPGTPAGWWGYPVFPIFGAVFLAGLLVAAIVTGHAGLFWGFFWIPLIFGGWRWWGMGYRSMRGYDYRYQRYIERDRFRQARWEARHGYLPPDDRDGDYGQYGQQPQLPQQSQQPQQPTPSAPANPPATPPQRPTANGTFTGGTPPVNPAG